MNKRYRRRCERWKTIKEFPNYEVSNRGNVKSLNYNNTKKPKILKTGTNADGYFHVSLCDGNSKKTIKIHQLVAMAFLGHKPCGHYLVVNHKDFNRKNNNVNNLEIVTQRENSNKKHLKSSSKYTGVYFNKAHQKWISSIRIGREFKHLGLFVNEIDASNAYQEYLKKLL